MSFSVIIPARYASTRLPGKPLRDIAGLPMIQHVYQNAQRSEAERIIVATDHAEIEACVKAFGGEVCMTSADHQSGTDRLQEVVTTLQFENDDIVVNVQGDEPLLPPQVINQLARNLRSCQTVAAATLCEPIQQYEDLVNPNVVKVVRDHQNHALYFSRAPIPWDRDHFLPQSSEKAAELPEGYSAWRHLGLYAYRVDVLKQFSTWPMSQLEKVEKLEQLRILENGHRIHIEPACEAVPGGVDTEADLQRTIQQLDKNSLYKGH